MQSLGLGFIMWVVLIFSGCSEQGLRDRIHDLEGRAFEGMVLDPEVRQDLMTEYANFARLFPEDAFAPEALFRRADLLVHAGKYELAVLQLQNVHDGFPAFDKRPDCALMMAYVYDVHLKDKSLARRAYLRTEALHPGTPQAEIALQSVALLDQGAQWLVAPSP
jgi:tetratricopeptide (TPR) repeat protein